MAKKERKKRELEKSDESLYNGNQTTLNLTRTNLKKFGDYCKTHNTSKIDALDEIITFLYQTNMPLSALKIQNDLHFMRKYHDFTASYLQNMQADLLRQQQQFHNDNREYLSKSMEIIANYSNNKSGSFDTKLEQIFYL